MIDLLSDAIRALAADRLSQGYEALLEADISSWLCHYLQAEASIESNELHFSARVVGVKGFVDLALGPVDYEAERRPAVRPRLALEIKLLPRSGFTPQQHRVHLEHVLEDDLSKLGRIRAPCCTCAELLVDGADYLDGLYGGVNRLEVIIRQRNKVGPHVHLFVLRLSGGLWQVVHKPPTQETTPEKG